MYKEKISTNPFLFDFLGKAYKAVGKISELKELFRFVVRLTEYKPEDYLVFYVAGNLGILLEDYDTAEKYYNAGIKLKEDFWGFYLGLAKFYKSKNETDKQLQAIEKAYQLDSKQSEIIVEYGIAYVRKGDDKKAQEIFNMLADLPYSLGEIYFYIAEFYLSEKLYNDAIRFFKLAMDNNYQCEAVYLKLGYIYTETENYEKAIELYNKCLELNPSNIKAYNNIGVIYAKQSDYSKAIEFFEKSISINKENPDAYYNLSLLYEKKGELL